jgi:hypothetical protein
MGGRDTEGANGIAVDLPGNVYATGSFQDDTTDFDPGEETLILDNVDDEDIFLLKLVF